MNADKLLMIAVAPNGARKTKQDHARLPITAKELAVTAANCLAAGACMIHLHVRDRQQRHTLDPNKYQEAITAIRNAVGAELIIQITTEAAGIYQPWQQMQTVKAMKPEAISLAIREICPAGTDESEAAEFFAWLYRERISPQYILYSIEDIRRFNELQANGIIPQENAVILLVLGRYNDKQQSNVADLLPLVAELKSQNNWWLCAFGPTEADCMQNAVELGGHCRVGFENNMYFPDGSMAPNNESLVALAAQNAAKLGRRCASPTEAREFMGMRS